MKPARKTNPPVRHGDFSQLASHYHHRVGYSKNVLRACRNAMGSPNTDIVVADIGAGTGKLAEELCSINLKVIAVEPNKEMREAGIKYTKALPVKWLEGSAESTPLDDSSVHWILMGSSLHWTNLPEALSEFHRVLKPGGYFTAIWNPRDLDRDPLQRKIDNQIKLMIPELKRASSGGKTYADQWTDKITSTDHFDDVLFIEGRHSVTMPKTRYLGLWDSVNDIQVQAGPKRWAAIKTMIETEIRTLDTIEVHYLSRAWTAKRK